MLRIYVAGGHRVGAGAAAREEDLGHGTTSATVALRRRFRGNFSSECRVADESWISILRLSIANRQTTSFILTSKKRHYREDGRHVHPPRRRPCRLPLRTSPKPMDGSRLRKESGSQGWRRSWKRTGQKSENEESDADDAKT